MAWTDYSNTLPANWSSDIGQEYSVTGVLYDPNNSIPPDGITVGGTMPYAFINKVSEFNIPGFDDGYQPASTPNPITNNISEGGGGGSTRPAGGFLYPRGQG